MTRKVRVTNQQFKKICEQIADGKSLSRICQSDEFPNQRTVLRHVQDSDEAYAEYRKARAL